MIKNDVRLFFFAFFLSLLASGWVAAFLLVDTTSSRYESGDSVSALSISQSDALHYRVALLGEEYSISIDPINQLEQHRKKLGCLLTPRKLLNAEIIASQLRYQWVKYYNQYLQEQYIQNIKKAPSD